MRILLADDNPEVRSALRLLLEQESRLTVVGEAAEALGLLAKADACCPDVLLLDWELPELRSAETLTVLHFLCPSLVVVALSGRPESQREATAAGVSLFVSKGDPPERLMSMLRTIAGEVRRRQLLRRDLSHRPPRTKKNKEVTKP